jgi:hypothetical protein
VGTGVQNTTAERHYQAKWNDNATGKGTTGGRLRGNREGGGGGRGGKRRKRPKRRQTTSFGPLVCFFSHFFNLLLTIFFIVLTTTTTPAQPPPQRTKRWGDGNGTKRGPRNVDDVPWAIGKFFFRSHLFPLTCIFRY